MNDFLDRQLNKLPKDRQKKVKQLAKEIIKDNKQLAKEGRKKISFEMDATDFYNLLSIISKDVFKYTCEAQLDLSLSKAEKDWMKKHGKYVQKSILNKIIKGAGLIPNDSI